MVLTKAKAKSLDILEVARSLGMEMKRKSHREYYWAEHDSFKIDTVKNTWHWYSQNLFGDTSISCNKCKMSAIKMLWYSWRQVPFLKQNQ